jgi:hypothetical protein
LQTPSPTCQTTPSHPEQPHKGEGEKVIAFAERSLQDREELASETLAELLIQQELRKAIEMYRLILIIPEKSSFAGKSKP